MLQKNLTVGVSTLGCKVSQYESDAISEAFEAAGFTPLPPSEPCDVYVINTCTVTAESDRKSRQIIRRSASANPDAIIMVTGCYPQANPQAVTVMPEVDYVGGTKNKTKLPARAIELLKTGKPDSPVVEIHDISDIPFEPMKITRAARTRAYLKIEDGCECRCAYCIIPNARGNVRSKPPPDVYDEVCTLVRSGCQEVVLTGIETASYGRDLVDVDLASLLLSLDDIDGLCRIRLGSLDPSVMTDSFIERIANLKKLMPHFHLSMQSGSDRILNLMKRRYNRENVLQSIEKLRNIIPNITFTTDMMVGFPQEDEEDFLLTVDFAKRAKFLNMHIFAYSKRDGTVAAKMTGHIKTSIKKERSARLSALNSKIKEEVVAEQIAKQPVLPVLFESFECGYAYGHTTNFIEVKVKSDKTLQGEIKNVRLVNADAEICEGVLSDYHSAHKHS